MQLNSQIKIGLDVHSTSNNHPNPDFWPNFTKAIVLAGGEIHIMTGRQLGKRLDDELKELRLAFTHIFSVASHLLTNGKRVRWEDSSNPWFDDEEWNSAKAIYAHKHNLDLVIDDQTEYGDFMETPFCAYKRGPGKLADSVMRKRDDAYVRIMGRPTQPEVVACPFCPLALPANAESCGDERDCPFPVE